MVARIHHHRCLVVTASSKAFDDDSVAGGGQGEPIGHLVEEQLVVADQALGSLRRLVPDDLHAANAERIEPNVRYAMPPVLVGHARLEKSYFSAPILLFQLVKSFAYALNSQGSLASGGLRVRNHVEPPLKCQKQLSLPLKLLDIQ